MHAPHTTCPGCREEIYLAELVKGCCPLCGWELEDLLGEEDQMDMGFGRGDLSWLVCAYFVFKKFDAMGADPLRILELMDQYEEACNSAMPGESPGAGMFAVEVPMRTFDRLFPRHCTNCGRLFFRGGRKFVIGVYGSPTLQSAFRCDSCVGQLPPAAPP
jgi:hypothetical protein